jgi:hypothetical protein
MPLLLLDEKNMHYKVTSKYIIIFLASHFVYLSLLLDNGKNFTHIYKALTNVGRFLNPLLVTSKFLARLYIWLAVFIFQNLHLHLQPDNFQKFHIHPRPNKQFVLKMWARLCPDTQKQPRFFERNLMLMNLKTISLPRFFHGNPTLKIIQVF